MSHVFHHNFMLEDRQSNMAISISVIGCLGSVTVHMSEVDLSRSTYGSFEASRREEHDAGKSNAVAILSKNY